MTEIEILNNSKRGFIHNAIYTLVVVFMTFISFRIARISNEKNTPAYGKILGTLFGVMTTFFGLQVSAYLSLRQKGLSFSLLELKSTSMKFNVLLLSLLFSISAIAQKDYLTFNIENNTKTDLMAFMLQVLIAIPGERIFYQTIFLKLGQP